VLFDAVLSDAVLSDPVPIALVLVLAAPVEVPPVWLPPLVSLEVGEPVPEGLDVDGLVVVGVDVGVVAVLVAAGVEVWHGFVVAMVLAWLVGVDVGVVASGEGVLVGLPVAVPVGLVVGVAVPVLVAVVLVAVVLSPGLAVLSAGLPVVLLAGLVAEASGVTLGEADLVAVSEGDGEGLGQAVAWALAWLLGTLLGLGLPAVVPICWPAPSVPWVPPLLWEEANPTAVPSWTKACRSGGTARATPMANTAQAAARPDRSKPTRQSRG
jgi:hypothetical protein